MKQQASVAAARVNSWLMPLLAMSLPLSTAAVTVLALLIAAAWAIEGDYARKFKEMIGNKVSLALIIFLLLYILGIAWSGDKSSAVEIIDKQWKLFLMPLFLTMVRPEHRRRNIYFFLAGLTAAMVLTYLAWFELYHYGGVTREHPTRKVFHVVYNPMLAFGFYLVVHEILWGGAGRAGRIGLVLLAGAMAMNMFITEGRAGQAAFFAMIVLLLLQYFNWNLLKGLFWAAIVIPVLFTAQYNLSPTFQQRVNAAWSEAAACKTDPGTSIGMRLLFWRNSWEIIRENPLIGVGTGDFKQAYAEVNARRSPGMLVTDNPHNQYVLVLSHLGLVGLVSLLAVFAVQVRQAFVTRDGLQRMRLALPVLFLLIMMSESYLLVFETGFLFSLFSGVLYKTESGRAQIA
ncbi:MAG: O-antigen ligase family protein [Desulfobulbaceae bacterium]|jgi:O-antigen ligase|nr:O-antigen ligase family protein [Desulfobulbaceae bacterium]